MRTFLVTSDAYGARGGIAQYTRDFIEALSRHTGCEEVVAIPRHAPDPPGTLPSRVRFVTKGLKSRLAFVLTALGEAARSSKFDLIVCGHIHLLPVAYLAKLRHRAPLVLMIYGIDAWQAHRSPLINALARRANFVASISRTTLDRFAAWAGGSRARSFILPNAIDLSRYAPGPKDARLIERYGLKDKTVLMTVGRLSAAERYKGVDEVLDVFGDLREEIPNLAYLVVGDGDDRGRLQAKARALRGSENIVFPGFVEEAEKPAHFRLADAYVMPSSGEGFGFVFLEAMACGIPAVASRVDGGREAVRDGLLGILVDPKDPADLRRGIREALAQPRGVVPAGLDYFSCENFEKRVQQMIDSVLVSQNGVPQ